jgi:hypothetical protein
MSVSTIIDCNGLSDAPTVLRIKQALIGLENKNLPLGVLLDDGCDCDRIEQSLGSLASDVRLNPLS